LERRALDPHALSRGFAIPASPRRESPTMRTRSLLRNAALALGAAFALSATLAHADPAHYFVVHEAPDGTLTVMSHALVELRGGAQQERPHAPDRLERRIDATVVDKSSNHVIFATSSSSS